MDLFTQVKTLLRKEILLEWRSKYAFNGILLYVVSTVFICYLSFRTAEPIVWNVLFWIIMLFAAVNAIAKSFLQESKGRQLYYYTIASPRAIILAKIIYNVLLMLLLTFVALAFYGLVFSFVPQDPLFYLVSITIGALCFSTVFTMVSAIAVKAGNNGTLMAVLSFPLIIPMLMMLIKLSKNAVDGIDRGFSYQLIGILLLSNVMVIAVALLLFPFLWKD